MVYRKCSLPNTAFICRPTDATNKSTSSKQSIIIINDTLLRHHPQSIPVAAAAAAAVPSEREQTAHTIFNSRLIQ